MQEIYQGDDFFKMLNAKVIENLEMCGGDSNVPHEVEFFLYFCTEEDSFRAAAFIQKAGFDVELSCEERNSVWLCLATKRLAPNSANINQLTRFLRKAAKSFNGDYDGWGTLVDKTP